MVPTGRLVDLSAELDVLNIRVLLIGLNRGAFQNNFIGEPIVETASGCSAMGFSDTFGGKQLPFSHFSVGRVCCGKRALEVPISASFPNFSP